MELELPSLTSYVYHLVPRDLRGSLLYPLNQLKTIFPDIAAQHAAKYHDRTHLPLQPIPPLQCVWNDVLMFSPVHPRFIRAALERAGHRRPPRHWFEVPLTPFTAENTVIYIPKAYQAAQRFLAYTPQTLAQYTAFPPLQEELYRQVAPGKPVLLFGGIAHVMYKGVLDLCDISSITV